MGSETLRRIFQPESSTEVGGSVFITKRSVNKDWTWIENKQTFIQGEKKKEVTVSHRLYSAAALADLLKGVGFGETEKFGNFAGDPYDDKATRLVIVGHKR